MDITTLENRIQAAYEAGVREGREEGIREGVSTVLHRIGQMQAQLAQQAYLSADGLGPLRPRQIFTVVR